MEWTVIKNSKFPVIASIGGSDSSAGAGIQCDIKTTLKMGAWCHTVVTAITAQTPLKVSEVFVLPVDQIKAQLDALFSLGPEFSPQVLKTGMLGRVETVKMLTDLIAENRRPLVVDTVFKATSGADLSDKRLPGAITEYLLPMTTLLTPNLGEAALLLGKEVATNVGEMRQQLDALLAKGWPAVLLKGGHLPGGRVVDLLGTSSEVSEFSSPKIVSSHTHGSGCALASAVAVGIAQKLDLVSAVIQARKNVRNFIQKASRYHFVDQNGPLIHFNLQEKERNNEAEG